MFKSNIAFQAGKFFCDLRGQLEFLELLEFIERVMKMIWAKQPSSLGKAVGYD